MTPTNTWHTARETILEERQMMRTLSVLLAATITALAFLCAQPPAAPAAPALGISMTQDSYEIQIVTIRATGGTYRLRFGNGATGVAETTDIPYDATNSTVAAALNNLTNITDGGGTVTVTKGGFNNIDQSRTYNVAFRGGPLFNTDVPLLQTAKGTPPLTGPYPDRAYVASGKPHQLRGNDRQLQYEINVKNTATTRPATGDVLTCNGTPPGKTWFGNPVPQFTYTWTADGVTIPGATASTYTVAAADAGKGIQCVVLGTVTGTGSPPGTLASVTSSLPAIVVDSPTPRVAPVPANPTAASGQRPTITASGSDRVCVPPTTWLLDADNDPSTAAVPFSGPWTYQWLRNGAPISTAESADVVTNTHTVLAADTNTLLQCRVIGTAPGGAASSSISINNLVGTKPADITTPPQNGATQTPAVVFANGTSGPVTVVVDMPAGTATRIPTFFKPGVQTTPPEGWSCAGQAATGSTPAQAICTRSNALAPQQAYPPIGIAIDVDPSEVSGGSATATVSGGGAALSASTASAFVALVDFPPFGLTPGLFETAVVDPGGDEYTQAGGHPWAATANFELNSHRELDDLTKTTGRLRTVRTDTPPGLVGNPSAVDVTCDNVQRLIVATDLGYCPLESVVGEVRYEGGGSNYGRAGGNSWASKALVAIEPERGAVAQFAFSDTTSQGIYVLKARLRPEDNYAVTIDTEPIVENPFPFTRIGVTICTRGAIAAAGSDPLVFRGCKNAGDAGAFDKPFLTNPTSCSGSPTTRLSVDSWEDPGVFMSEEIDEPVSTGCENVPFTPTVAMSPTSSVADSPSGLDASIDIPADGLEDPDGISQAHLRKTVVELPEGVSVNPSAATGLEGCTDEQLGLKTDSEPLCPDASKLGTVEATTPVLDETLSGVLVLRTPKSTDPMSGEMLRVALIVRNDERGVLVKLPGSATADPSTGRLTATFDDNPQLPIGHVEVHLRGGDKGVLAMGRDCGEVSTKVTLTPWSGNADAVSDTPLAVDERCGDGFAPKLAAGSSDNRARGQGGTYSFKFSREDGEQWLRGLTAKLPKGLLASVKDVPLCSNGLADAGNCPASSKIGVVDAKAGSGDPFVLEEKGEVFLTEGYKGGEYGLAVKIRPVAGPFRGEYELSPIVVRQAIHVDRTTAEVTAVSDPFPLIHHGIPLRAREVNVLVNRNGFMLNPSDCTQKQSSATLLSDEGTTAGFADPFQVSGCANLPFKPKLALSLTGKRQVTTGKHPGIKAVVTQQGTSEAGIEQAIVRLPKSLALDPNNAQALCEFEDGTKPDLENRCPAGSIVGRARAKTPLLKDDLVGNVYFVKNVRKDPTTGNLIRTLPMIVVALRGEIAINLKGESSTTPGGKLVNTFASVPDAPISQFNLNIKGGPNGIIAVTRTRRSKINLCTGRHTAEADIDGHNGRRHDTDIRMKTPCTTKQTKAAKLRAKRAAAKARS